MQGIAISKAPPPVFGPVAGLALVQLLAIGAALALVGLTSSDSPGTVAVIATVAFLIGGLPHGAFDLHLAAGRARLGRNRFAVFSAIYVGLFVGMLVGWAVAPAIVLPLFLLTAILHFAADWPETDEPVFRIALGFAPICAIGIGHLAQVEAIFAVMATPASALWATRAFILVAPITLLIAATALLVIARHAGWWRPAAFAALLASLFVLPPLIGFALFFCAFHTPRHLVAIQSRLAHWHSHRLVLVGVVMTAMALVLGAVALPLILAGGILTAATGFQLLAALAMPHQSVGLILRRLERG